MNANVGEDSDSEKKSDAEYNEDGSKSYYFDYGKVGIQETTTAERKREELRRASQRTMKTVKLCTLRT